MSDSQFQRAGDGSTPIHVSMTIDVSYAELDNVSHERKELTQDFLSQTQAMTRRSGIEPGPMLAKTLVPRLQFACLERDHYLREGSASQLATTIAGRGLSFIYSLSLLTRPDVLLLGKIADYAMKFAGEHFQTQSQITNSLRGVEFGWLDSKSSRCIPEPCFFDGDSPPDRHYMQNTEFSKLQ